MSLCLLRVSLSGFLTASDKGSLTTFGELFNISALDPLLPTLLIATLCLCVLLTIFYYSLVAAWEVFWASRRSPSPLDPSAEVVLTFTLQRNLLYHSLTPIASFPPPPWTWCLLRSAENQVQGWHVVARPLIHRTSVVHPPKHRVDQLSSSSKTDLRRSMPFLWHIFVGKSLH